jgi:hypothetical protein
METCCRTDRFRRHVAAHGHAADRLYAAANGLRASADRLRVAAHRIRVSTDWLRHADGRVRQRRNADAAYRLWRHATPAAVWLHAAAGDWLWRLVDVQPTAAAAATATTTARPDRVQPDAALVDGCPHRRFFRREPQCPFQRLCSDEGRHVRRRLDSLATARLVAVRRSARSTDRFRRQRHDAADDRVHAATAKLRLLPGVLWTVLVAPDSRARS